MAAINQRGEATYLVTRKLSHAEQWSYPNLAVLDDVLDSGEATLDGIELAFTAERPLLADCIKAVAHSADLSSPAIAAEAASALECWREGDRGVIDVMFAPPPGTPPSCHASRLDEHDTAAMLAAIGAASDWISDIACKLLTLEPDPGIGQRTELLIDQMPANRRINAAIVIVMNDPDPANKVRELLHRDNGVVRIGASIAAYIIAGRGESGAWKPILEQAIGDDDLAVRMAAGAELSGGKTALCWTCGECGWTNRIDSASCESCGRTMNFNTPRNPA